MQKYRYSRANLVIGMAMATLIERSLHVSISLYGNYFLFTRPVTLALFLFVLFTMALPFWRRAKARRRALAAGGQSS
jgi:TctA family transporter